MESYLAHNLQLIGLPAASLCAGVLNTIAGGGSFLTLPILLATMQARGFSSVSAQATNITALWPGQWSSIAVFRQDLRLHAHRIVPLSLASLAGGIVGAWLLLLTPNQRFLHLLPWLMLFAATMFFVSDWLGRWTARHRAAHVSEFWLITGMIAVSAYVGYFGAGGGFLVMALLAVCGITGMREMIALKTVNGLVSIGIAVAWFALHGRIAWRDCMAMAVLATVGGYLAAHSSRKIDPVWMRRFVSFIGFATAAWFFWSDYRH